MDEQEFNRAYEAWENASKNNYKIDDALKKIVSDNASFRGEARSTLEGIINQHTPNLVGPNTPTESMLRHADPAARIYAETAVYNLRKDPKKFVNKAYSEEKFAKNYLQIVPFIFVEKDGKYVPQPIKTGDEKIDRIIQAHLNYNQLDKILEAFESGAKSDPKKAAEIIKGLGELVEAELFRSLIASGASEESIKRRIALAMEVYKAEPERIYLTARNLRDNARKYIDSQFADSKEKAEYAKKILDTKASAHEVNYGSLSEDLYKIIK